MMQDFQKKMTHSVRIFVHSELNFLIVESIKKK